MNAVHNDDWIWIEDEDRYPKNFLDKDDLPLAALQQVINSAMSANNHKES